MIRPGGGQNYSGGGGGGGGGGFGGGGGGGFGGSHSYSTGSGYSSSGGDSSSASIGEVVLVLFILIIVVIIQALQKGVRNRTDRTIGQAMRDMDQQVPQARALASIEALRQHDPNVSEQAIFAKVERISTLTRDAWLSGNMVGARAVVSDGVYGRFNVQLSIMRADGVKNVMSDARTLYTTLEGVESTADLDVVHVRYTGAARDADVPLNMSPDDVSRALHRKSVEEYTEIWSLVRRRGAASKLDAAQFGNACPNCGAPLGDGSSIKCRYCSAVICSGEYDWVLAEITQASEWRAAGPSAEGLDELHEADPGTLKETLEDRASYLFWKWVEAGRLGTPAPLRKSASPAFVQNAPAAPTQGVTQIAVGGCDLVACDSGGAGQMDYAYVKLYWSGLWPNRQAPTPMQSILRLARRSGVVSEARFTAMVCPACGAPLTDSDSSRCDHCNVELTDGERQWVLDDVGGPGSVRLRRQQTAPPEWMLPQVSDPRERQLLFRQMAAIMNADGKIGRAERRLLTMTATRWSIPTTTLEAYLAQPPELEVGPLGSASAPWFLAGMVSAALADGQIDARERAALERACAAMKLPPQMLEQLIQDARARLAVPRN